MEPLLCKLAHKWEYKRLNVAYNDYRRNRSHRLRDCLRCGRREAMIGGMVTYWISVTELCPAIEGQLITDLKNAGIMGEPSTLLIPAAAPEEELMRPV